MKKIGWKFYTQRSGKGLSSLLGEARTLDEAKKKLDEINLTFPPDALIQEALDKLISRDKKRAAKAAAAKIPRAKKTAPRRSRKKSAPANKGSKTEESTKPSNEPNQTEELPAHENTKNEKYFRRVVPTKKSRS